MIRLKLTATSAVPPAFLIFQILVAAASAHAEGGWTNRYSGPGNIPDNAVGIAVDGSNVFVAGWAATVAYSSAGVPSWTNGYTSGGNVTAIALGQGSQVFVTGTSQGFSSSYDYVTIAYSAIGTRLWTNRYNGSPTYLDVANAVATDRNGNVFVTGYSYGFNQSDYATVAYSSAGVPLWERRYDGSNPLAGDAATAIAVDGSGNIFVTGNTSGGNSFGDVATIAYSNVGTPLWTNYYNGPGNQQDWAVDIAVDGVGNAVVAGYSVRNGSYDYATIAYASTGTPLWTNFYNGPGNDTDRMAGVALDGNGNVYVTGNSSGGGSSQDYATIAYSSTGVPLWTNRFNGRGNTNDIPTAIAVDNSGNVHVTGYSTIVGTNTEIVTLAYSSAGVPLRTNYYGGFGIGTNRATAIAVDEAGNVYVAGSSFGPNTGLDYVTIKYPSLNAASPIQLLRPRIEAGEFVFYLQTDANRDYNVDTRTNLTTSPWDFVTTVVGDGTEKEVRTPVGNIPEAYYRVVSD